MASALVEIRNITNRIWEYEISGTSPYKWFVDGVLQEGDQDLPLGQTTDNEKRFVSSSANEPPSVQFQDSTEFSNVPTMLQYPWSTRLQWFGDDFVGSYTIEQLVGSTWTFVQGLIADGPKYYAFDTGTLSDSAEHSFRVKKVDDEGNESGYVTFTETMVRTPDPPSYNVQYLPDTNTLLVSEH